MSSSDERAEARNQQGERVDTDEREDRGAAEHEVAERASGGDRPPHRRLSNPASDPDPTEHPDPYDERPDPRGPDGSVDPGEGAGRGEHPEAPRSPSDSEPHPPRNREAEQREGHER